MVSIDSPDDFASNSYLGKDFQMTSNHFFRPKTLTMTISKKLFLKSQNHPKYESSKIYVFVIFLTSDLIDASDGPPNDVNRLPWSFGPEPTSKKWLSTTLPPFFKPKMALVRPLWSPWKKVIGVQFSQNRTFLHFPDFYADWDVVRSSKWSQSIPLMILHLTHT